MQIMTDSGGNSSGRPHGKKRYCCNRGNRLAAAGNTVPQTLAGMSAGPKGLADGLTAVGLSGKPIGDIKKKVNKGECPVGTFVL